MAPRPSPIASSSASFCYTCCWLEHPLRHQHPLSKIASTTDTCSTPILSSSPSCCRLKSPAHLCCIYLRAPTKGPSTPFPSSIWISRRLSAKHLPLRPQWPSPMPSPMRTTSELKTSGYIGRGDFIVRADHLSLITVAMNPSRPTSPCCRTWQQAPLQE